jgi:exodeoxyribonuclease VII large subunit
MRLSYSIMAQYALPFSFPPPASWTVTDLTRYLRQLFENDEALQDVWVQGEISNFSRPSSGHLYFTIKDSGAALRCVMWRNNAARLQFMPRDGEAVEAHGVISIYEAGGQYQLYADALRPAGEGALYQEFLRLKAKLEAEGLFEAERKRPIPAQPKRIGIITSPTGAALRDILNTLRRRYPLVEVVLAPTAVQGDEAPGGIAAAFKLLNSLTQPDVILLARGGGSIEDLWAFNDERVARAIVDSTCPVISGVGHETDFTIADFVADLRAPTPTAAAELAVPDQADLRADLTELDNHLARLALANVSDQRWDLQALNNHLLLYSPRPRLLSDKQRVDELAFRLSTAARHTLKLEAAYIQGLTQRLASLSPQAVLERGFAILYDRDGEHIRSVNQVSPGDRLQAQLNDGTLSAQVEEIRPSPKKELT